MNYVERSYNTVTLLSLDTKIGEKRCIFIEGEITDSTANEFRKQMLMLNWESMEKVITVCINSPGGEIRQGLMMYDIIQGSIAPVRTICTGQACSMAAIILACGNPNYGRFILPNSTVMIHEPIIRGGLGGNASSIKSLSDSLMEMRREINGILAKHTGHTVEEIDDATSVDHFFTAEEAVEYGLCDEVVDFGFLVREV